MSKTKIIVRWFTFKTKQLQRLAAATASKATPYYRQRLAMKDKTLATQRGMQELHTLIDDGR